MSRPTGIFNVFRAARARWATRTGVMNAINTTPTYDPFIGIDYGVDNNWMEKARTSDFTDLREVWRMDSDNVLRLAGDASYPMTTSIQFPLATSASIVNQQFFIAPFPMKILSIDCIFATANGAAQTAVVEKLTSTQALGAGIAVMTSTFNMNSTANTRQTATLPKSDPAAPSATIFPKATMLATGDRLALKLSTAITSLAGVVITVHCLPGSKGQIAVYNMQANGDLADQTFYIANRDEIVTAAYAVVGTKGTNGSAVNVQVVKDTSTNAPGAGTDLLTNNTNAGFNLKNTIYTVETGALTATAASLRLAPGDRLAVDFAGTLTAVAGVVVVVVLQAVAQRKEVSYTLLKNGNLVDQAFFTADRNYEIKAITEIHATAGNDGGSVNLQVTRDTAADAPGAGTDLLSNNTSAGFNLKGTANTLQTGTFVNTAFNYLMVGDRLSVDYAGTLTTLAGVTVTVSLIPA